MKTSHLVVSLIGITLVAGTIIHLARNQAPSDPPLAAEPAPDTPLAPSPRVDVPNEEPLEPAPQSPNEPAQASDAIPAAGGAASESAAGFASPPTPFSQAIDTLVSPQASFQQKHETWTQLEEAGQLDQVIEALTEGAAENPTSAVYPATLGQALLHKAGVLSRNGGTISEMGILGMQADQNFDAALRLDPANWEAQFFKAAAMSHWPLELNKGEEVIQRLSSLIDQQDAVLPQPQFAQTYVMLGDQYRKMGRPDYAAAAWQIGAQRFPGNPELQQRASGH